MGTKHPQALAFVSVSDLIRDKSINAATEHDACYHPFVISTSFMTPDHEENVKDAKEEDHDDLDTIDECYEYTKNMMRTKITVPNCPNKLSDGTIKKTQPRNNKELLRQPNCHEPDRGVLGKLFVSDEQPAARERHRSSDPETSFKGES